MLGRFISALLFLLFAGCAAMQQQQAATIVQEAKTQLQTIMQTCMQRIDADREIDPIRNKIELVRTGIAGAPPPNMLSDQSRPTAQEKAAIAKWESVRESCAQQQMQYGLSLSLPTSLQSVRDRLVLVGRETNQKTGLLVAALYDGRLTYWQFATERMKISDQMVASLTGGPQSPTPQPSPTMSPQMPATALDEIPLRKQGNSYYVAVSINGFPPMPFVLDTGANSVVLPKELVLTLIRAGTLQQSDLIAPISTRMADNSEFQTVAFRIRELRVGEHVIRNVTGVVVPTGSDALLGVSFLSQFGSVTIDNHRNVLVLSR
jgi:clan AA aspartic protease (TIGR02281 family)